MKTLDEIIDGTTSDEVSLSSLLRKCLVIADKLKNDKLKTWVLSELNGYKEKETIPPYRIFPVQALGTFLGPFAQLNDQPLTPTVLKLLRSEVSTVRARFCYANDCRLIASQMSTAERAQWFCD